MKLFKSEYLWGIKYNFEMQNKKKINQYIILMQ